ncbi:hypothetical protein [Streptomyces sp. NPDC048659]|uniref:hypothetical protein n=1 Tax=Streptomyces sp. NPDC048659 TaxID=3155489 RepID=UPI003416B724
MADALGLAPMTENLPDIGGRLIIRGGASLYYGHPMSVLRLPHTSPRWQRHILAGGLAVLALGLAPIPPGTGQDGIDEYLFRHGADDRVLMGATSLRRRWT